MNKIILSGTIGWDIEISEIRDKLDSANGADLEIHLASPGGSVFDGIEIFNLFRDYKRNHPTAQMLLTIKGEAASMAAYLAVNPAWDLITAEDNAVFMIHNAWGGVVGDYREVSKMAEILDGLTQIIGKAFAQKTGKSIKEIRSLMDDESWYFGDEMQSAGFVDEIIKTDNPKNKESAIVECRIKYESAMQKLKAEDIKTDVDKIAALIKPEIIVNEENDLNPADIAGENNMEVMSMTLKEFLEQNPTANAEHERMLNEKFEAGKKSVQDRIAGAMNYLEPDSAYPGPIRSLAVKTVKGEVSLDSLSAAVATYDSLAEKKKSDDAKDESDKNDDIHGQQEPDEVDPKDGVIKNEAQFMNRVNRNKAEKGMEVK